MLCQNRAEVVCTRFLRTVELGGRCEIGGSKAAGDRKPPAPACRGNQRVFWHEHPISAHISTQLFHA